MRDLISKIEDLIDLTVLIMALPELVTAADIVDRQVKHLAIVVQDIEHDRIEEINDRMAQWVKISAAHLSKDVAAKLGDFSSVETEEISLADVTKLSAYLVVIGV